MRKTTYHLRDIVSWRDSNTAHVKVLPFEFLCLAEYYALIKISNNRKRVTNENKFTSTEKRSIIPPNLLCRACRRADAHFSAFTSSINAVSTSSQPAGTGVGAGEGVGVGVPWSESPPSSTTLVKLAFTAATSAEISWNCNTRNTFHKLLCKWQYGGWRTL